MTNKPCSYCGKIHYSFDHEVICEERKVDLPLSENHTGIPDRDFDKEIKELKNDCLILSDEIRAEKVSHVKTKRKLEAALLKIESLKQTMYRLQMPARTTKVE
jgi:hypothetical protein